MRYDYGDDVIYEETAKPSFWEIIDSKKENIEIKVYKTSTLIKQALFAMFYPFGIALVVLVLVSLYHKSLSLFTNELIDIFKVNACWMLVVASFYFIGGVIYNRIKYDYKLEKSGSRDFILDKSIFSVWF